MRAQTASAGSTNPKWENHRVWHVQKAATAQNFGSTARQAHAIRTLCALLGCIMLLVGATQQRPTASHRPIACPVRLAKFRLRAQSRARISARTAWKSDPKAVDNVTSAHPADIEAYMHRSDACRAPKDSTSRRRGQNCAPAALARSMLCLVAMLRAASQPVRLQRRARHLFPHHDAWIRGRQNVSCHPPLGASLSTTTL